LLDPDVAHRVMQFEQSLLDHPTVMQIDSAYTDILRANAVIRDQDNAAYTKPVRDGARRLLPGELAEGDMVLAAFGDPTVPRRITADALNGATTLRLKAADYQSMRDLLNGPLSPDAQAEAGVRVAPFGEAWDGYSAIDLLVDSHITTTSAALAAIFGLVALMMRSARFAFAIMVPMTITLGCVYAFLSLTGLTLGLATSMFAAVAIGASADYAIHFAVSWRAARRAGSTAEHATHVAFEKAGQAILSAAFVVAGGVSVMLLSSIPPNTALASLILASLFCSALMTLFVLPGLLTFLDRRRLL
jgi:predicted RND superfamily exporter protein